MNKKIYELMFFILGIFLLLSGIIGFIYLFKTSKNYKHTVCIVEKYNRKKVYKYRKLRYENTMLISYETDKYGKLYTTLKSYYPFRKKGDKIALWYEPDKPRNIKLPFSEICIYILLTALGLISLYAGIIIIKNKADI
ncbi:hypothetical protein [uncultured Brachyspira sp.]|uniref:hypothetical protein n=1 Tax=uncultured Brachyspira sp. TaxID=221953 RepID=UPI0025E7628A|nr:hypothetical protein [uncultured Brachyspira sp.]